MIRPSTTMKIATAIRKTTVYSSRIFAPCSVTATGGEKLFSRVLPAATRLKPIATRIADTTIRARPMAIAKIATDEGRDLGEPDIKILEGAGAPPGGTVDRFGQQAWSTALGRADHILPG